MYNDNDDDQKYKNEQEKFNEFIKNNMNKDGNVIIELTQDMPYYMQLLNAFRSSKHYLKYLSIPTGRVVIYFMFMTFIAAMFSIFVPLAGRLIGVNGVGSFITEKIPDFTYENGVLQSEAPMQYERDGVQFFLDTGVDKYSKDDLDKEAVLQILVSKSNVIINEQGRVVDYSFKDFPEFTFSKAILLSNTPVIYAMLGITALFSYLTLMFTTLFTAFMLTLVGLLLTFMNNFDLKYGAMLKLAIYATTIGAILSAVNTAIPFISASTISIIGIVWTSIAYFNALIRAGVLNKMLKNVQNR